MVVGEGWGLFGEFELWECGGCEGFHLADGDLVEFDQPVGLREIHCFGVSVKLLRPACDLIPSNSTELK